MAKYKEFGKRILAVLMTVAVVLTASSVDIEALAAALGGLGDATGYSIPRNGYIGEIVTNSEGDNQQIDKVSFKLVQEANRSYPYTVTLYENPTDPTNPESGVLRKTLSGSIASVAVTGEQTIEIDIPSTDPIVLTAGESLGVAIRLNPAITGDVQYYEKADGDGFRKDTSSSNWEKRGDIILVTTSDYTDDLDDVESVSMNPSKKVFSVGDADVPLNGSVTPSYKREIQYVSNNEAALTIVGNAAHANTSGMAVVTATCGTKTAQKTFYILDANVTAGPYPYTGEAVEPTVTVKCGETTLERGKDYTLTCSNNINPGTASYTITGIGTYVGYSKSGTYTISTGTITQDMVTNGTYVIDTNTDTVTNATVGTLRFGTDFTVQATRTSTSILGITYSVRVQGIGNYEGDYTTSKSYAPGTDKLDINSVLNARLTGGTVDDDTYYYTGSPIQPNNNDPSNKNILFTNKGGTGVVDFTYYTLSYSGDPTNASEDEPKKVIIEGDETKGYTGKIELEYWILPRPIKDATITLAKESQTSDCYIHTGSAKTPAVTVTYNSVGRTQGTDYTVEYRDNVDVGTATVVIKGKGNFSGSTTKPFEIIPDFVKDAKVNIEGYQTDYNRGFATAYAIAYNGNEQKPRVRWLKLNDETLDGNQYNVDWSDNVDAGNGTGKVIITGKENTRYAGQTFTATFTITPKQLTNSVIIHQLNHPYSGTPVTLEPGEYNVYDGATMLEENKHYTISYSNNTNAGNGALITATGKGNYTGAITGTFSIAPLPITDNKITIDGIVDKGYTGAAQTQDNLVVKLNEKPLDASNYTLSYTNNTNVGTATVTITGTGNLTGSTSRNFQINPKSLEGLTYTVGGKPCTGSGPELEATFKGAYTGLEVKPAVVVSEGGSTVSSSDYTLHYYNNINIGDAYVEVTGKNAYQGSSVIIKYQITKRSIANATITVTGHEMRIDDKMYPKVTVVDPTASYGYRNLVEGTHYKIETDETSAGAGLTAKIVGINNYEGEQEITYDAGYDIGTCGEEKLYIPGATTPIEKDSSGDYTYEYIGEQKPKINISDKIHTGDISGSGQCSFSYRNISGNGYDAGSEVEVTVTGTSEDYYGTMQFKYKVTAKDISTLDIEDGNTSTTKTDDWTYTYDSQGKDVTPILTYDILPTASKTLVQGTDFRVNDKTATTVGPDVTESEKVVISGRGNYVGSQTVYYKINPCNMASTDVTIDNITPQQYTGSEIKPKVNVYLKVEGKTDRILIGPTSGYTVTYTNNINPSDPDHDIWAIATIEGNKNFTGTKDKEFQIIQRALDPSNTTVTGISDQVFDGSEKRPDKFTVSYDNIILTKGTDYEVFYHNNINIGKGTDSASSEGPVIEIRGKGAYKGTIYKGFTIRGNIAEDRFVVSGLPNTYEIVGGQITIPTYQITYTVSSGSPITVDPSYYTLKQPSPLMPGPATITISGNGDVMFGAKPIPVTLTGRLSEATIENIDEIYNYTGSEVKPEPLVKYNGNTLTKGRDYIVEYSPDTTSVGSASLTIKPAEGSYYSGEKSIGYGIRYNLYNAQITGYNTSYPYTQSAIEPHDLTVTIAEQELVEGNDYTVSYGHNTNVSEGGTITITATGNNTTGSKTVRFNITKVTLDSTNCTATFNPNRYPYTGQAITPEPLVRYTAAGRNLTLGSDYTLEYPEDIINASTGAKIVTVKGTGNYEGSVTGEYYIDPAVITAAMVTVGDAYYAGGLAITPPHTISYKGNTFVEGRDYDITYGDNRKQVRDNNPITFTFKGNYTGTVNTTFNIKEADLSKGVVTLSNTQSEYTGASITPGIVATIDTGSGSTYELKPGIDYDVIHDDIKNAGDYEIVVKGKGNFVNSLSATYTVTPRSLNGKNINIEYDPNQEWTGEPVEPPVSITDNTRIGAGTSAAVTVVLTKGVDYNVEYLYNTDAAPATADNPPTIKITGIGNYAGVVDKAFNIGHPLGDLDIYLTPTSSYTYDGKIYEPTVTVKRGDKVLKEGTDYEKAFSNADGSALDGNAGGKLVTITGKNGYYQYKSVPFDIMPKTANANKIKIVPDLLKDSSGNYYTTYTGADIEPSVTVYDLEISDTVPVSPNDYTVEYERNKDMSTPTNPALIKIKFQNNYYDMGADKYTSKFYIKAKTIETGFEAYLPGGTQYAYTGKEVKPEVIVKSTSPETVAGDLEEGKDYTLTYKNNVNAGIATVVVTGINNYSGQKELNYNVVANLADATITAPDQFYTGAEVHAPLTIKCGGNTLVEGVDYTVTYTSDDNWESKGTATINSLQPYYAGEATKDYKILFDPSLLKVTGYANEYGYTGNPIKPNFRIVTPSGEEIAYNPYDIVYYNSNTGPGDCTSIGTVTATIPLNIGSKSCELKVEYDIIGKNINLCNIVPLYDNVYTGKKLYPPVIIRNEQGELLTEGVDYTLEYSDNIYPGVGKIVITGKGNYIASVTKYFNIIAPNMLGLSAAPEGDNAVKLSWLRNARITGYEIYSGDASVKYGSTTDTTFTITGLKQATDYQFKVRTYITANGKTSYGEFKSVVGHTGMSAPNVTVQSLARQRATINWNVIGNVSGYEIYRGISPTGTFNKIAVMPSSAGGYSDSNLVSGGTYYYKVRAYEKIGENQFIYGYFSDPKAVTIR